jgi:hypothetical protein
MVFETLLKPEMLTAMSVFLGALFAGVVAVIAELRKSESEAPGPRIREQGPVDPDAEAVCACVRDEADHVARTVWIVEKKLSDHLHRIELAIARAGLAQSAAVAPSSSAPAVGPAEGTGAAVQA